MIKTIFMWGTVIASGVAAFFWFMSTIAFVEPGPRTEMSITFFGREMDVFGTMKKQTWWNKLAAASAAIAALCQALYLAM